jgi:hypothetical protein
LRVATFYELTGILDVKVAILLSLIVYWYQQITTRGSQGGIFRNGFMWIAKNREQWAAATGLTRSQCRRATAILNDKHLIDIKIMKLDGTPTTHLRLLTENLEKAVSNACGDMVIAS